MDEKERKIEELEKKLSEAELDAGLANIYKDIIRSVDQNSKNMRTFAVILSITTILLLIIMSFTQWDFAKYREESITKHEIIEMFESLKNGDT